MNAPTLLLVHGYPFDHTLWDLVRPLLDKEARVIAPDLRGFGAHPGTDEPSLERMAEDLATLLDEHQVEAAAVAGMSMGGYVALAFVELFPDRTAGLGLISSQASADSAEARENRRKMIEKVRREGAAIAASSAIPKLFTQANSDRPDLLRYAIQGAERAGVDGIVWALEAMARRPDRTGLLKSLRIPVLIAHGLEDQFVPAARAREFAQLPVSSRYVEIEQAGHATPLEAPGIVADALNDLVKRSFNSRGSASRSADRRREVSQ